MHPDDVAALVADEFGDLRRQLSDRGDPNIGAVELVAPTEIRIGFSARAYESQMVGTGVILPGAEGLQSARRIPILGSTTRRPLVLVIGCDNWDGWPPEFELRLADGAPLAEWPKGTTNGGIAQGHPDYDRPFFCRQGTREYHTHPVHADDPWDLHREGLSLAGIVLGILEDLMHRWMMG